MKSKSKSKPKILGVIPARGGSKGIKNKNIANLRGRPLIGWAVKACAGSKMLGKVVVATDNGEIARIAQTYGANVLVRPNNISGDKSRDIEFLQHAVAFEEKEWKWHSDIIAWFPPTCPTRTAQDIDAVLEYMVKRNLDSVRTAIEPEIHPLKQWIVFRGNPAPVLALIDDFHSLGQGVPRQLLPQAWIPFGLVNATKTKFIKKGLLYGMKHEFYMVDPNKYLDIDTPEQLEKAQTKVREFGIK